MKYAITWTRPYTPNDDPWPRIEEIDNTRSTFRNWSEAEFFADNDDTIATDVIDLEPDEVEIMALFLAQFDNVTVTMEVHIVA